MKTITIIALSLLTLVSCNKKKSIDPSSNGEKHYTLRIEGWLTGRSTLYINGQVTNGDPSVGIDVKTKDHIEYTNVGQDSYMFPSGVKNEGYVNTTVYLDSQPKYNITCYCDAHYIFDVN